jgi:DNA polymerase I-like protein with 3'-5' exonuclease and polymerase domains
MLVIDTETYPEKNLPSRWGLKRPYVRLLTVAGKNRESTKVIDFKKKKEEQIKEIIEKVMEKGVIGHNLQFDLKALWITYGKPILPKGIWDTMVHEFFIHPRYRERSFFSLKETAERRLKEVISKEQQKSDWSGELSKEQIEYAKEDVEVTKRIFLHQQKDLTSIIRGIKKVRYVELTKRYGEILPLGYALVHDIVPFLALMEYWGIPFDVEQSKTLSEKLEKEINDLKEKLKVLTGVSKVESRDFLEAFKRLGYSEVDSLAQEKIEKLWGRLSPMQKTVYLLRKDYVVKKREQAFIKQALQFEIEGRVYPFWTQTTKTGRITSSVPNVQNLPKKSKIRELIRPEKGFTFVSIDFPQIELRLAAKWIEAGIDEALMQFPFLEIERGLIYALDKDVHSLTAAALLGKMPEEVNEEERKMGKVINFSFLYGGKEALRSALISSFPELASRITEEVVEEIIKTFYELYPDIEFFHKVMVQTKKTFYTLAGTPIFPYKKTDALNYPIQASGADLLKYIAVNVMKKFKNEMEEGQIRPIMVIHDELIFEVEEKTAENFSATLDALVKEAIVKFTGTDVAEKLVVIKDRF